MSEDRDRRITRRGFFKGAGIAAAGGALIGPLESLASEPAPPEGVPTLGAEAAPLTLRVNGREAQVSAAPRDTLLDVLRLPLDLTGAKPVCDRGQCGACTVWLDGLPVYACMVLAVEAAGREVTTIEGLGDPTAMHPVQRAFVDHDGLQCGFCTPGMVMSCAWAVRRHGKDLTATQVREATSGNLCRCGTHPHVVRAALAAARG